MKTFAPAMVLVALLAGCGKKPEPASAPPAVPAAAPAAPPAAAVPAPAPAAQAGPAQFPPLPPRPPKEPDPIRDGTPPPPSAPNVALTVNGQQVDPQLVAGWPVVVRVELSSPDGKPWKLPGAVVRLEMPGGDAWPLAAAPRSTPDVVVDQGGGAAYVWTLTEAESAALPRVVRTMQAVLESPGTASESWKGSARSSVSRVTIVDEPKRPSVEQVQWKSEVLVEAAYWRDGADKALAVLAEEKKKLPNNWRMTSMKAQLLVRAGRAEEGLVTTELSIDEWRRQNPRAEHPPVDLLARRDRLVQSLLKKK